MYTILLVLVLLMISLYAVRQNEKFKIIITQVPRGVEAMKESIHGRRTLVPDIFPDHRETLTTLMPSGFADQAPDKVLGRYMAGEAFAEDFTNTRACMGAVKLDMKSGFALPTRWEDTVCETHCPDYSMVGTRADSAGNLSINSRDALYNHVGWNIKEIGTDNNEKEYISMQNYVSTDRDSG